MSLSQKLKGADDTHMAPMRTVSGIRIVEDMTVVHMVPPFSRQKLTRALPQLEGLVLKLQNN